MNEIQFNAVRKAGAAAGKLAERFGMKRPSFYQPHGDPEITMTRALLAEADFLDVLADKLPPVEEVDVPVVEEVVVKPVRAKRGKKA